MLERDATPADPDQLTSPDLVPAGDLNTTVVNERVVIRDDPRVGWRVVTVSGVPLASYGLKDKVSQRHASVALHILGLAEQAAICAAFGHSRASQARWEMLYRQRGVEGLVLEEPPGRRSLVKRDVEDAVEKLHEQGLGLRRIAARLGLSVNQVVRVYRVRGITPHGSGSQEELFAETAAEAADEGGTVEGDTTPAEAEEAGALPGGAPWSDGLLTPEPEDGENVPFAGGLMAAPVLARLRAVEAFTRVYRGFGPVALYGLELLVTLMVLLALWRIKRPEQLKSVAPVELGRALGLPRAPEVKTVRRKLAQLAKQGLAREALLELSKLRLEREESMVGYLYLDGHVREYSGKEDLAQAYSTLRNQPVRATTDTWVADRHGDPILLVTSQVNEHLTQTLEAVLADVRGLVGEKRRVTVIFDRGGWSPQLFARLIDAGFDLITYHKGRSRDLPKRSFHKETFAAEGGPVSYELHDQDQVQVGAGAVEWKGGEKRPLLMRQVTRLKRSTGHQTQVLTTRRDIGAAEVLWRMFARWRLENYFKYMMEEMDVDGLVEYGADPVDDEVERPNPDLRALAREIAAVKRQISALQSQRCELVGERKSRSPDPPGFERFIPGEAKTDQLLAKVCSLKTHLEELEQRRRELPRRVSAGELRRLRSDRQQVATVFKTLAYQVETDLVRLLAPHYSRTEDEGRKLVAAALRSAARVEVTEHEVRVTLAPQSSPHRSRAVAALCASLNTLGATYPGTRRRLLLDCAVQQPTHAS